MNHVKGNLLDLFDQGKFDVIVHGCNCFHEMMGGIAAQIAQRYPEAVDADLRTEYGDDGKMGTYSVAFRGDQVIINGYTQYLPGPHADLDAIRSVFERLRINVLAEGETVSVGIPMIGAGIGGLTWDEVEQIIDEMCFEDITVVEFDPTV